MIMLGFLNISTPTLKAQNDNQSDTPVAKSTSAASSEKLSFGPFNLHPRAEAGLTYDDNILFSPSNTEADVIWNIQPGLQAVAGDDAALISYRDNGNDVIGLSAGSLIIQPVTDWPGKLLMLDYAPRFQFYDHYTANNFVDQFANLNFLLPFSKLVLGFNSGYQLQKTTIIEAAQFARVETSSSTLSVAYRISEKSSLESDLHFNLVSYDQPGLTGYKEFGTESWFNYFVAAGLYASAGVLAGQDEVADGQNQTYEQLRARARYDYTEKLVLDISAGTELRQYENGHAQTLTPVFSAAAEYRPAARTTVRLTGYRQQYSAIFNGDYYISTGATMDLRQGVTERFTVDVSIGFFAQDNTPITIVSPSYTDDYYSARIGLEAKIIWHLNGDIYYQRVSRLSQTGGDINDNQAGLQFNLSY
jgi:hypothetical protein